MFQIIKREKYFRKYNFQGVHGAGHQMFMWLKQNSWPADDFLDWFMRVYPNGDDGTPDEFKYFIYFQFEWVHLDDVNSLKFLYEMVTKPEFQSQDKGNLTRWLKTMLDEVNNRSN